MSINNATPEAYALYLDGQKHFSIIEREHLDAAAAKFRAAAAAAPQFARAWGHIAYTLTQIVVAGHAKDEAEAEKLLKEAEILARKAVELDKDDYANEWDLAFVLLTRDRKKEAFIEYGKALTLFDEVTDKLDRRNDLLVEMAEAYVYDGNTDKAMELLDRAVRVPDWYRWIRAWAHFNAREYKKAIAEINAMHKQAGDPGYVPDIQLLLAAAYAYDEQPQQATEAIARLRKSRANWTMARELARNPFTKECDREHWETGMKKAGFS